MKRTVFLLFIFKFTNLISQVTTGIVIDFQTSEPLPYVYITSSKDTVFSDNTGHFSIFHIEKDTLTFSLLGYEKKEIKISRNFPKKIIVKLNPQNKELKEVKIISQKYELKSSNLGVYRITRKEILKSGSLFGENDILKYIQNLPGISFGLEGTNSIYVRGSSNSENLILLDGAPIFNITHLGGFFSIVNPYSIKSVTFYKSKIPARFSGRTASVIDIYLKEGNKQKTKIITNFGIISSSFMIEGPLVKNKISYVFTVRRNFFDIFSKFYFWLNNQKTYNFQFYFYDLTSKLTYSINKTTKIQLSLYTGKDILKNKINNQAILDSEQINYINQLNINWRNDLLNIRIDKFFDNFLLKSNFYITNYSFNFFNEYIKQSTNERSNVYNNYKFLNGISETGNKTILSYKTKRGFINTGFKVNNQTLKPFFMNFIMKVLMTQYIKKI